MPAKRIPRRSLFIPLPASLVNIWIRSRRFHPLRSMGSDADLGRIPLVVLFWLKFGVSFQGVPEARPFTERPIGLLAVSKHQAAELSQCAWILGGGREGGKKKPLRPSKERSSPNRVAFCFRTEAVLLFGWTSIPTSLHALRRAPRGEG